MIVDYADYKDSAPGADGLEVKRQILNWVLPYHEGAVKALKEAGVWTAEAQKHNDMLVKRQDTLGEAWADFTKANPPADKDAFAEGVDGGAQGGARKGGPAVGLRLTARKRPPGHAAWQYGADLAGLAILVATVVAALLLRDAPGRTSEESDRWRAFWKAFAFSISAVTSPARSAAPCWATSAPR